MITYLITGDNVSIDQKLHDYIEKRFAKFERFMDGKERREIAVTASKSTSRDRDDRYRIEVRSRMRGADFFAVAESGELMSAVDLAKEELMRDVTREKGKRLTLFHRGARRIKNIAKGVYNLRPKFTRKSK